MKEKEIAAVQKALETVLGGDDINETLAYELGEISTPEGLGALLDAAEQVSNKYISKRFDSCSIVNVRSGKCTEDCKWCAQSGHFHTGCEEYEMMDAEEALHVARYNAERGVLRYSPVGSGRAVRGKALDEVCHILREASKTGISTCASLGLLTADDMKKLKDAGVARYHCNMETAPSHFGTLCTSHGQEHKMRTIQAAKEAGLDICCGGIIGMGESRRQRTEFALFLREVDPVSIPLNILSPIPGTPLESVPLLGDDDILHAVGLFRMVHPRRELRFAGGRGRLSREVQLKALKAGINGAIVGDLLTTVGSTIAEDKELAKEAGYEW